MNRRRFLKQASKALVGVAGVAPAFFDIGQAYQTSRWRTPWHVLHAQYLKGRVPGAPTEEFLFAMDEVSMAEFRQRWPVRVVKGKLHTVRLVDAVGDRWVSGPDGLPENVLPTLPELKSGVATMMIEEQRSRGMLTDVPPYSWPKRRLYETVNDIDAIDKRGLDIAYGTLRKGHRFDHLPDRLKFERSDILAKADKINREVGQELLKLIPEIYGGDHG